MRSLWFWKAFMDKHWHDDLARASTNNHVIIISFCNIILSLVVSGYAASLRDTLEDCDTIIREESCKILLSLQKKLMAYLQEESKAAIFEQLRLDSIN